MLKRGWRAYIIASLLVILGIFLFLGVYCKGTSCSLSSSTRHHISRDQSEILDYEASRLVPGHFAPHLLDKDYELDLDDEDVLVFLHIQKTGGTTFGRHLVKHLDVGKPCVCNRHEKKCECLTRKKTLWLFSRYSTGWACGLHADWTELKNCVDTAMDKQEKIHRKRRYHYITILRDPVNRYLSEYKHVSRGATWKTARLFCNGREATLEEVPFCYDGENWEGVDLGSFLGCKYNLANNRQTRMLANLSKVNCYNKTGISEEERNRKMLESAIENLQNFSFFGLTEFQRDTQLLFEHTFHLEFIDDFEQVNNSHISRIRPTEDQIEKVKQFNQLDIKLYEFAKELFKQRVNNMKAEKLKLNPSDMQDDDDSPVFSGDS